MYSEELKFNIKIQRYNDLNGEEKIKIYIDEKEIADFRAEEFKVFGIGYDAGIAAALHVISKQKNNITGD